MSCHSLLNKLGVWLEVVSYVCSLPLALPQSGSNDYCFVHSPRCGLA